MEHIHSYNRSFDILYALYISYLIHENIKDACGDRKREKGEKKREEPGWGIHGSVETLGPEMDIQLWKLLLKSQMLTKNKNRKES